MKLTFLTISLFTSIIAHSQSLPDWFTAIYTKKGLDKEYVLISLIKPSFLEADFNADTYEDIAVLVVSSQENKEKRSAYYPSENEYLRYFGSR